MLNQGWTYTDKVRSAVAGQSVLDYYAAYYCHSDRTVWKERIETGQILLDGNRTQTNTRLKRGQILSYVRSPWQEPAAPLDFDILYEDDDLWVIAKPSGLPVLPGGGFLEHTLLHQLRARYPTQQPIPVHRLGRGTSGAMLIAKSYAARKQLSWQFRYRTANLGTATDKDCPLSKTYRALIGQTTPDQLGDRFTCSYPIGKLPHKRLGYIYGHRPDIPTLEETANPISSMVSRSQLIVLQRNACSTLVEVTIQTGRPHQIRIHLAAAGHPLLGDPLYPIGGAPDPNGSALPGDSGYHLHAHRLRFAHPRTGQSMTITAPPPAILS